MMVEAWGETKTIQDWLLDHRVNPEVTYDVLRRRIKRGGGMAIPEVAITYPVIKGAQKGDTKARVEDRKRKQKERYKKFVVAKKVRERYNAGVEKAEIKERFSLTESQYQKIISHMEFFNIHWDKCGSGQVPPHFAELQREVEGMYGAKVGLEKYEKN